MAAIATRQLCEGETTLSLLASIMIMQSLVGICALCVITWINPEMLQMDPQDLLCAGGYGILEP